MKNCFAAVRPAIASLVALLSSLCALPTTAAMELVEVVKVLEKSTLRIDVQLSGNKGVFGSGVVIDSRGFVLTNFHVIAGARKAKVTLPSGATHEVQGLLGADPGRDLAILKVEGLADAPAIKIAASLPQPGEKVAAYGNPNGYSFSISEGIVAAIRTGKEVSEAITPKNYKRLGYDLAAAWIQTTTAISGGNSGGPLVNMNAELLGLITWQDTTGQNLNFAVAAPDIIALKTKSENAPVVAFAGLSTNDPDGEHEALSRAARLERMKVPFPTGHVFSFDILLPDRELADSNGGESSPAVIKHPNGTLYGAAQHTAGILNGLSVVQYDNGKPRFAIGYLDNKRHGVLHTWNEAGKAVLIAQYVKGKRHGFTSFFDKGSLRLLIEYQLNQPKWIQLMHDTTVLKGFSDRGAADMDSAAREVLVRLDDVEKALLTNEVAFKKQVMAVEVQNRKLLAAQLGPEKRRRRQMEIDQRTAQEDAFSRQLFQRAMGR